MGEEAETIQKKDEKSQPSKEKRQRKEKPRKLTKVIIRRLPPTMDEETFLKQVDPLPDYEQFYFVPADWSLAHDATSRAYVTLVNQEDVFLFRDRFDGYVFVDTKGAEYPAVVEFAPFQGLAKSKSRKNDPKCNTIETDLHYIAFLKKLEADASEANKQETKIEFTLPSSNNENQVTSTPLLQYLANKKQERRDEQKRKMEEKRRQREEERQRKKDKLAKTMPKTIKEEDKGDPEKEDRDAKKRKDTYKESRSKRRQERDAKRREEREKNLKARAEKTESNPPKSEPAEEGEKKKEIKKYSESRRDKRRSRNSGKETEQSDTKIEKRESQESTSDQKEGPQGEKDSSQKSETNVAEMTDSVKEFIKSVANIKEFVPRNRDNGNGNAAKEIPSNSGNEVDVPKPKLAAVSVKELEESLFEKRGSEENSTATENSAKDTSKEREERARRIRNKDRPSIEIYQPGKMRLSTKKEDGRSSVELKEPKSGAEADDPKSENEERQPTRRRVSRYSERRSSRNKERGEGVSNEKQEVASVSSDRAPSAPETKPEGN